MASFLTSLVASQLHAVVDSLTSPFCSNWAAYDQVLAAPSLPAVCPEVETPLRSSRKTSRAPSPLQQLLPAKSAAAPVALHPSVLSLEVAYSSATAYSTLAEASYEQDLDLLLSRGYTIGSLPTGRAYNRLMERLEREDRRLRREGEYASPDGFGALLLEEALQSTVFPDRVDECDFALDTHPFADDAASLLSSAESASSANDSDADETATIASTAATSLRSLGKRA
ncbi:hypothetical protein JCM10207_004233 [Rhodosporidiobolus poonsookiae]